eukprot:5204135-Pyramimonas_sp.AAC.1
MPHGERYTTVSSHTATPKNSRFWDYRQGRKELRSKLAGSSALRWFQTARTRGTGWGVSPPSPTVRVPLEPEVVVPPRKVRKGSKGFERVQKGSKGFKRV